MEVILRETIDNLGRAGQVVKVADGYARNYLLPRKLAYLVTPGNLKVIEFERQSLLRKETKQKGDAESLKQTLDNIELMIRRKVGEQNALYGSVTNSDVADELEKKAGTVFTARTSALAGGKSLDDADQHSVATKREGKR